MMITDVHCTINLIGQKYVLTLRQNRNFAGTAGKRLYGYYIFLADSLKSHASPTCRTCVTFLFSSCPRKVSSLLYHLRWQQLRRYSFQDLSYSNYKERLPLFCFKTASFIFRSADQNFFLKLNITLYQRKVWLMANHHQF